MTTQPQTALPPLIDQWSGGFGFQVVSADRTAALVVSLTNHLRFYQGRVPEVAVLPDPRWQARIEIGHNLRYGPGGAPTEPSPVVDETWPIVAGTVTILEMASTSAGCGPGGLVRALFEDFEALTPNGTRVTLGDFEVSNEHWGCVGL